MNTNHFTKKEIKKRLEKLTNQRTVMKDLEADTSEIDFLIHQWKTRYDNL